MKWPNKDERESWEIDKFISHYSAATKKSRLKVISKGERPDYLIGADGSLGKYGVELTSVYLSDRSVPNEHIPSFEGLKANPYCSEQANKYQHRTLEAIFTKDAKARKGYSKENPILLSIYINEYIAHHIEVEEWQEFFEVNNFSVSDTIFKSIVLWPLPNDEELVLR